MKNQLKIKLFLFSFFLSIAFISCEKDNSEMETNALTSVSNLQASIPENVDEQKEFISLMGSNGRYISSENGRKSMTCNRTEVGAWEIFELVDLGNRKYALKGSNGKYVSSENGLKAMTCSRDKVGVWETFFLGHTGGGVFFSQFNDRWTNGEWLFISNENPNSEATLTSTKADLNNEDGSDNQDVLFTISYL